MFNVIPFRAARNLMNTSMDDMLSDRFFRNFFDMSDMAVSYTHLTLPTNSRV